MENKKVWVVKFHRLYSPYGCDAGVKVFASERAAEKWIADNRDSNAEAYSSSYEVEG